MEHTLRESTTKDKVWVDKTKEPMEVETRHYIALFEPCKNCTNCARWSENIPECQYERELGNTICSFWERA